jgi:hypothetical protein
MARQPKLFVHIGSTNLIPSDPISFEIRATTHHWRGELLEKWATAKMKYKDIYQTENAFDYLKQTFLGLQETLEPSKDINIIFPETVEKSHSLSREDKEYYDAVKLATSQGWCWEESFNENLITGERKTMGGSKPYLLSLDTWEWGGNTLGSSVAFSHSQREGESKASHLTRILGTAEQAKHDFPDAIPYTNIFGEIKKDDFKTRVVFGS